MKVHVTYSILWYYSLSLSLVRRILRQVIEGLIYLHSYNIIHRDLSLSNLLLTTSMNAVRSYNPNLLQLLIYRKLLTLV